MAYIKPSVLVYQELQNAGGVANITPDLGSVIIGPLYNVVRVDVMDADSLTTTQGAASTDLSAVVSASNVSYSIFNNVVTVISNDHGLEAGNVIEITGDTETPVKIFTDNVRVVVKEAGRDSFTFDFQTDDHAAGDTFDYTYVGLRVNLTGTFPGQLVEQSSVQLYGSDVYVKTTSFDALLNETVSARFSGTTTRDSFNFGWVNATKTYLETFIPSGALPEVLLPDSSGKHIALNDKVVIEYLNPDNVFDTYASVNAGVVTLDSGSRSTNLAAAGTVRVRGVTAGNPVVGSYTVVSADTVPYPDPAHKKSTYAELIPTANTVGVGYSISTNVVTVDVGAAHGLLGGDTVRIEKASQFTGIADYTEVEVVNTPTANSFTFAYTAGNCPVGTGVSFSVTSNVVTVTRVGHGLVASDKVKISNAGVIPNGTEVTVVTIVDADNFTFAYTTPDTTGTLDYTLFLDYATLVRIERLSVYTVTSNVVTVTRANHGFTVGDEISVTFESGPGGLGFGDTAIVQTVPTASTFTFNFVIPDDISGTSEIGVTKTVKHETKVSKLVKVVNTNTGLEIINGFKIATPIENFAYKGDAAVIGAISLYRHYDVIELPGSVSLDNGVPDTQIDYLGLDNDYVVLEDVFSAYANVSSTLIPGVDEDSYEVRSGKFHIAYRAVRQDKYSTVLTINDTAELEANLGDVSELNPLALGVSLANSNTTTSVMAVSLKAELVDGVPVFDWDTAMEMLENQAEAYALAPLTQDLGVLSKFKTHVLQMSEPKNAAWRVLICNTEIPAIKYVLSSATEAADPEVALTTGRTRDIAGVLYFTDSATAGGPDFIEAGVTPGDQLVVTASADVDLIGSWTVDEVINGKTLKLVEAAFSTPTITVGVSATYYVQRTLTKAMQAEHILATSETFNSNRVWHVQPDIVGVNVRGTVKYLPGYYLCAALSGMTAGFPVQQGFTNISVAGIDDLKHSNFYFKREQLNSTISDKAGTCWFVQDAQGGIPYCRHELTTDNSVLEYREILKVKNWDFLSYYYFEKMSPYIGSWNITDDTLSVMKQVMIAASELLLKQKLPRIGAPLVAYQTPTIEQDEVNKDTTNIRIPVSIADPNNYTNLYIVI